MREAFEAWAATQPALNTARVKRRDCEILGGEYADCETRWAYRAWQAAYRRGVEDAAAVVRENQVNLGARGWPKELIPRGDLPVDAISATYAAGILALLPDPAPQRADTAGGGDDA